VSFAKDRLVLCGVGGVWWWSAAGQVQTSDPNSFGRRFVPKAVIDGYETISPLTTLMGHLILLFCGLDFEKNIL